MWAKSCAEHLRPSDDGQTDGPIQSQANHISGGVSNGGVIQAWRTRRLRAEVSWFAGSSGSSSGQKCGPESASACVALNGLVNISGAPADRSTNANHYDWLAHRNVPSTLVRRTDVLEDSQTCRPATQQDEQAHQANQFQTDGQTDNDSWTTGAPDWRLRTTSEQASCSSSTDRRNVVCSPGHTVNEEDDQLLRNRLPWHQTRTHV